MGDFIITIKKGDNLTKIAKEHGTTVKELQKLNNIKNANKIIAGETIKIPNKMGTTVEHTETKPQDEETRKARELANQKKIKEMNAMKNAPKEITAEPLQDIVVIGKAPKKEVASFFKEPTVEPMPVISLRKTPEKGNNSQEKSDIKELINIEIRKRNLKNIDISYWTEKIDKVSSEFDISPKILTSIISRETAFSKNRTGRNGKGAMQQTSVAIRDFFPGSKGNRFDLYNKLDSKLVEDILFKKDGNGNILKDEKGRYYLKYNSYDDLLRACAKDDELSIKVGALLFKMQYANAIARSTGKNISNVIGDLKDNKLNISESKNKEYIASAVQWYNGSKYMYSYKRDVIDSLQRQKFDFAEQIVGKKA